jgi:hypothetical protein
LSARRLEIRNSVVPGPRRVIKVDVAEAAVPALIEGIRPERVWLVPRAPDLYTLHTVETPGESRKRPGPSAIDVLVAALNDFADELDADDVPQRLRDLWDAAVEQYNARTGPKP